MVYCIVSQISSVIRITGENLLHVQVSRSFSSYSFRIFRKEDWNLDEFKTFCLSASPLSVLHFCQLLTYFSTTLHSKTSQESHRHLKINILKSFCFLQIPSSFSCLSNLVEYTSTYLDDQWGSKNYWHHFLALHIVILVIAESTQSIYKHSFLWLFSTSDLDHCSSPLRCSLLPLLPCSKHHFL